MRYFKTLIPTDIWFRPVIFLVISLVALTAVYIIMPEIFDWDLIKYFVYSFFGLLIITIPDLYLRRGYRISYDQKAVYWRKVGPHGRFSKKVTMPFVAISEVSSEMGSLNIKPFEAVILRSADTDLADVVLSKMYLQDSDIRELLAEVCNRSQAMIDDDVRAYLSEI